MKRYTFLSCKIPKNPNAKPRHKLLEGEILSQCKFWLSLQPNIWHVRLEAQVKIVAKGIKVQSEAHGMPDLLLCRAGRMIAIELKRAGEGDLSGDQVEKLTGIIKAGGMGAVVCSLEGLRNALSEKPFDTIISTPIADIPVFF